MSRWGRLFAAALILCFVLGSTCCSGAGLSDKCVVTNGSVRFSVLTPTLVRMEYSPTSKFCDLPTAVVLNRSNWPAAAVKTSEKDGWLEVSTDKLTLRYKTGSGAFTANNLTISWQDSSGKHEWKPGDKDDKNLGGTTDWALQWIETPPTNPGLISRAGYTFIDDSRTPVWQDSTQWIAPRPEKDSLDQYLFIYGSDYLRFFKEYTDLTGPIPLMPRWSLGAGFSSRVCYSAEEDEKIAWRFRDEGIPMDMMLTDSCTSAKAIWSGYDFDLEQMPDPQGFYAWINKHGFHIGRNEHYGGLERSDSHFEPMRKAMGLPADTKEINFDLSEQEVRGGVHGSMSKAHTRYGPGLLVDGRQPGYAHGRPGAYHVDS